MASASAAGKAELLNLNNIAASQGYTIEDIHASSTIEKIKLAEVKVDRTYQREPSQNLVDQIADNYDVVSAELLLCSLRKGGVMYVVNGQHRSLAALKAGHGEVWARVINLEDAADPGAIEAMFRLRTNVRMKDKPLERFKAQLRAGDPESRAIVRILEQFDTEVNDTAIAETGINAVTSVESLYRLDDGVLLTEVLGVVRDAFKYVGGKNASSNILKGIAWFTMKHAGGTGKNAGERDRLVEKLHEVGHAALDRRARTIQATMSGPIWLNYYRGMVDVYNERLSEASRLDWVTIGASSWKGGGGRWGGTY